MSIRTAHITLDVGCDFDADAENGIIWTWEGVDLADATAVMKVRSSFSDDDETVLLSLTEAESASGQVVLVAGEVDGTIEPRVTAAGVTALVTAAGGTGSFVYDVVITLSTGKARKYAIGNLIVKQTASRASES